MSNISTWSTVAASNNSAAPDGWPEGMAPSSVNDAGREMMAAVRTQWEDKEWFDYGDTPTRTGNTTFTVPGNQTANYTANRPIRCTDSSTLYGYITGSTYSAVTTCTVSLDSGNLSASLSAVALGHENTGDPIHVNALRGVGAVANGFTGQSSYTNGQLLIGNTTGNTLTKATLTAGNGITVTNGTGSISLAANLSAGTGITVTPGAATSIAVTTPVSAANGCALTLVQTQAASGSASITFSSLSADTYYILKFRLTKSANDKLNVRVNNDSTANRHGKAGDTQDETATETIEGYANGTELAVEGPSGAASEFISGTVEFVTRPSDNTQTHLNYQTCTSGNTTTNVVNSNGSGKYNGTALSSIVVFPGSGTITGSISLYSVKTA